MVEVLKEGGIPVIEISSDPETGNLTLNVVKASNVPGYTAVSHVWSDGLGNSEQNELNACQLAYINSCLQNLQNQEKKPLSFLRGRFRRERSISPVAFWLDTYYVPVARQYQEYGWQAIELIAETYCNAQRVLVLDSEMQLASVKGERAELIMRLYCSAWMRRLWTLQEGVLAAKNLHVQLSDGAVNLFDDVWKRGYSRAYSGMTEDVRGRYSMFKYFLNHPYEYEALVFLNRFTRLSNMAQVPLHQRFAFAWDEVRWRSTSRKTDDTICFAGILGLNASNLFQSKDDPETERLVKLFSLLDEFPSNILFAPGLHMKAVGWTWAPAVLPKAYRSMVLELPRTYGNSPRMTSVARRDEQGLWVKLSGFVLAPRTLSLTVPFTISYGIFRWQVQPEDSHHLQSIKPDSGLMSLGLILSDGVPADLWISGPQLAEATMPRLAVVVHLLGQDEDLIRCTYISRVNLTLLPDANTPERGPSVSETQEACRRGFQTVDLERINDHHSPALITSDSQEWCIR